MSRSALIFTEDFVEALAQAVATRVEGLVETNEPRDGYLAPEAAATYLGVSKKRIYDLKSSRALEPDGFDGRTPLFTRDGLDRYARSER